MTPAEKRVSAARTALVLDQPFWGTLALSLTPKEDPTCRTAWTDGRSLGYNPDFIASLSHAETVGLIAHEVSHCALGHPWRRDGRDPKQWNIACDYAINGDLLESGFSLPKGGLSPDATQLGKSSEWIYARLPQPQPQPQGGQGGQGQPQPGNDPAGEVRDAPTGPDENGEPAPTEGEWKQRTAEALQAAKMQGSLPGGLARLIENSLDKRVDVRSLLLRFMTERTRADYSWNTPNSRYIAHGLYLPALQSISLGEVAIMVDTSGSVDTQSLAYARRIVEDVISECSPSACTVWYADAKVCHVARFEQGEPLVWEPEGGGGTDFRPALRAIEDEGTAVCVLCITDLCGTFPDGCSLPVLWLATTDRVAPFGETIPLPE
jgi:predicted metal-dependent peptidase